MDVNGEFGGSMNLQGLESFVRVRVETSTSPARYKTPASCVVNTKSGANQLRGSLYDPQTTGHQKRESEARCLPSVIPSPPTGSLPTQESTGAPGGHHDSPHRYPSQALQLTGATTTARSTDSSATPQAPSPQTGAPHQCAHLKSGAAPAGHARTRACITCNSTQRAPQC